VTGCDLLAVIPVDGATGTDPATPTARIVDVAGEARDHVDVWHHEE
jgi:hypothetical protein